MIVCLSVVVSGVIAGYCSAKFAQILDFSMKKGHLLDFIRDKKTGVKLEEEFTHFGERLEAYENEHWKAALDKKIALWVCHICFGFRFIVPLFIIGGVLFFGITWESLFYSIILISVYYEFV